MRNLDDRPLQLRGVALRVPVERLLFEAERTAGYRLTYGSSDQTAPSYDLARTAGDLVAWSDGASRRVWGLRGGWWLRGTKIAPGRSATRRSCGAASSRWSWRWGR